MFKSLKMKFSAPICECGEKRSWTLTFPGDDNGLAAEVVCKNCNVYIFIPSKTLSANFGIVVEGEGKEPTSNMWETTTTVEVPQEQPYKPDLLSLLLSMPSLPQRDPVFDKETRSGFGAGFGAGLEEK